MWRGRISCGFDAQQDAIGHFSVAQVCPIPEDLSLSHADQKRISFLRIDDIGSSFGFTGCCERQMVRMVIITIAKM